MSRYARNVDRNHAETVKVFRAMGCEVVDTSRLGQGIPDLYVSRGIRYAWVEVKDGRKVPSARKLTPLEQAWRDRFERAGIHWALVECPEDAQALVNSWARYVPGGHAATDPHADCRRQGLACGAEEPMPCDEALMPRRRHG